MDGQPFLFINQEVDPGLLATLRQDVVPWLEANVPSTAGQQQRLAADPHTPRFTLVFDREAYSPAFFDEMRAQHIAILGDQKYPGESWREDEFAAYTAELAGGETSTLRRAERGTRLSNGLWVREIRKLSESGHQTSILTTNYSVD